MLGYQKFNKIKNPTFSIILPTWRNLNYLQLCVASVLKNSRYQHQIIIHSNETTKEINEWIDNQQIDHTFSEKNIGICYAMNAAVSLAESDYILYLNDDMYVCPDWDFYLLEEIKKCENEYFFISASLIEPRYTGNSSVCAPFDFGNCTENFDEKKLLNDLAKIPANDWQGSTWPPSVVHRKIWNLVGGYSTEFSPGMYSDSDFSMKLWQAGVRHFQGVGKSKVYHFMSKSTGKVKKNNGRKQFLKKWNISSSTFYKYYLRIGTPFLGKTNEPELTNKLKLRLLRDKIKVKFNL